MAVILSIGCGQGPGKLLPMPINLTTVNGLYDCRFTSTELERYFATVAEPCSDVRTSEDVVVSKVGRDLYETFVKQLYA